MNLNLTALPGEALLVAIFEFAKTSRETMSQENIDRLDSANISLLEDWIKFWRSTGAFISGNKTT